MGWTLGFGSSVLADQVFFLALTWAALRVGTPSQVGVVLAAGSLPRLFILLVGGAVADSVSPKRIIVGTDTGRAVVMAAAALVLLHGWSMSTWELVVIALIIGGLDGLFLPAVGALPALIAPQQLMGRVAALRTVTQRVAMLIGGPLAGWLIYRYGPAGAFGGSAVLFALSVGSLTLIATIPSGRIGSTPRRNAEPRPTYRARLSSGVRFVRGDPVLPWLLLLIAGMNFGFAGPVTAGLPLLAAQHHWGAQGAGLLVGGFGFGAAATGLGLVFVRHIPRAGLVCTAGVTTMGVSLALLTWADTIPQAMAAVTVLGLASGLFGTVAHAMVLTSTPATSSAA